VMTIYSQAKFEQSIYIDVNDGVCIYYLT